MCTCRLWGRNQRLTGRQNTNNDGKLKDKAETKELTDNSEETGKETGICLVDQSEHSTNITHSKMWANKSKVRNLMVVLYCRQYTVNYFLRQHTIRPKKYI